MLKTFDIILDVEKDIYTPANILFNVSRNDFESIQLNFTITQDDAAVDLTGQTVEMAIKKPSGLVVHQAVDLTDPTAGKASARLSMQAYVEFGLHTAELYIRDVNSLAITSPFYFYSRESIMQAAESPESVNDWSALQEALFAYDLKPLLVDGIPEVLPEYVGQMAFDQIGGRIFFAHDLTETGWRLFAAGEGGTGGGIIYWADIIGKPESFPAEPHTHGLDEITGLQTALDGKADDADLLPYITETDADARYATKGEIPTITPAAWGGITGDLADQTDLKAALDGKADDADLLPYITEAEADVKYAAKGETGGITAATWGEITGDITTQGDLQAALGSKADDADLAAKADAAHRHDWAEIDGKPAAYPPEIHTHDFVDIQGKPATYPPDAHDHPEYLTQLEADGRYALRDAEGGTIASVDWGTITGDLAAQTDLQTALAAKADDADLATKADANHAHTFAEITEKPAAYPAEAHDHQIGEIVGLQTALDGKADDADLAAKADAAHSHTFAEITEKPLSYPPDVHRHDWAEIDGKPAAYPAEDHDHDIASITGLQTALDGKADDADLAAKADAADLAAKADAIHSHTFAEITEKPAAYPPEDHDHDLASITGLQAALDGKADDADLAAKADAAHVHTFAEITEKPATYPPDAHNHDIASITGLDAALAGKADDGDLAAYITEADADLKYALKEEAGNVDLSGLQEKADVVTALPTTIPEYVGQMAIDEVGGKTYIANGSTAASWERLADTTYVDVADNYIISTLLAGLKLWKGTQAAYEGITTKDPNTLYFITG